MTCCSPAWLCRFRRLGDQYSQRSSSMYLRNYMATVGGCSRMNWRLFPRGVLPKNALALYQGTGFTIWTCAAESWLAMRE